MVYSLRWGLRFKWKCRRHEMTKRTTRGWIMRYESPILWVSVICGLFSAAVGAAFETWWAVVVLASSSVTIGFPFSVWSRASNKASNIALPIMSAIFLAIGVSGTICTNTQLGETSFCNVLTSPDGLEQWAPVYVACGFTLFGVFLSAIYQR